MAMPQRDDAIEVIKRRAAEKRTAEEKKKAEARTRAAHRREQRRERGAECNASRRPAGTGEEGMGDSFLNSPAGGSD